jgi:hypothetical protein
MNQTNLIHKAAKARIAANECARRISKQGDMIRRLTAAGDRTGNAESALSNLRSEHLNLTLEIKRTLDELARLKAEQNSP